MEWLSYISNTNTQQGVVFSSNLMLRLKAAGVAVAVAEAKEHSENKILY